MIQSVLVAISGGIDSAAVVLMLRERGFAVTGLYIDMLGCEEARAKAVGVAEKLGVELYIENVAEEFREKIIGHTLNEHQAGRTPSPCVVCNPMIKWAVTERVADRLGICHIATGHYVRISNGVVRKGVDSTKDQSYYLWGLSAETLNRAITPLGDFTKKDVREFLERHEGFETLATGGESMSICFVGRTPYNEFLGRNLDVEPGDVVDEQGAVVGRHEGYQLYTIGQKRGFTGYGAVVEVIPEQNRIVVSQDPAKLYCDTITLRDCVLRSDLDPIYRSIDVKVRGLGRNPQSGLKSIEYLADGSIRITLNSADAWAVAQGQPVVFYDGDRLLGGGIVRS